MKAKLKGSAVFVERAKGPSPAGLPDSLQAANPRGRIARWRPLADEYGAGDILDQAEALIDERGNVSEWGRFKTLVAEAIQVIKDESNEQVVIPQAARDYRRQAGCSKGGQEGGAAKREAAESTRQKVVETAEKLLESGRQRRGIASIIGMRLNITPRHIRDILKQEGI